MGLQVNHKHYLTLTLNLVLSIGRSWIQVKPQRTFENMDLSLVLLSTKHLCNLHCTLMATEELHAPPPPPPPASNTQALDWGVGGNPESCKRR